MDTHTAPTPNGSARKKSPAKQIVYPWKKGITVTITGLSEEAKLTDISSAIEFARRLNHKARQANLSLAELELYLAAMTEAERLASEAKQAREQAARLIDIPKLVAHNG